MATSQTTQPLLLLNAATANGAGASSLTLGQAYSLVTLQVNITGAPSALNVQLQGSLDQFNWFNIGTAATGTSTNVSYPGTPNQGFSYIRANLTGLTGGTAPTVTVYAVGVA